MQTGDVGSGIGFGARLMVGEARIMRPTRELKSASFRMVLAVVYSLVGMMAMSTMVVYAGPTVDIDDDGTDTSPANSLEHMYRDNPSLVNSTSTGHAMDGTMTVNGTTYYFGNHTMGAEAEHTLQHVDTSTLRELADAPDGVYMSVDVTGRIRNGDRVRLTIANSSGNRNAKHWIAAYAEGPSPKVHLHVPVKYAAIADVDPNYPATGTAQVEFKLINMRSSYIFKLFEEDWQKGRHWYGSVVSPHLGRLYKTCVSSCIYHRGPHAATPPPLTFPPYLLRPPLSLSCILSSVQGLAIE